MIKFNFRWEKIKCEVAKDKRQQRHTPVFVTVKKIVGITKTITVTQIRGEDTDQVSSRRY